ncbi:hypothetical protein LCGC14_0643140 [marine sediment metagenome]|uniref:Bacteriophage Mu GpT domain-containing protein n=1 Tax=marine sediment metagenome TaxID=412755 RepID=A0A0F9R3S1_9ZZZZ
MKITNHPKALWPGIHAWFGRKYDEHPMEYPFGFEIAGASKQNYEEDVLVTGFGLAPVKVQGQSVTFDSESQGFVKRYVHVVYGIGYIVTEEELDDNLYEVVSMRRSEAAAFSLRQTEETVCANVYNRGFNSSFTGGDGVRLFIATHPSKAGNWSNILAPAADISETALEDICIQIMGVTNDKGLKISLVPKSLQVHRNDWFEANRILRSVLQNDTTNNALNILKSTNAIPEGPFINHYFTDTDAFFVRTNCPHGMTYFLRKDKVFRRDNDFATDNALAKCQKRFSVGWTDPRGCFASSGA